jgi:hypothetical protein
MKLVDRFMAAGRGFFGVVQKDGAPFPFNKIMPYDATGGEKLTHPYEHSVWVRRAIRKISGPVSAVELKFAKNGTAYEDDALAAWWQHPARASRQADGTGAALLDWSEFVEATVGWLKLEGESFWILDDDWAAPMRDPAQRSPLILARPDRMHHIVKRGELVGWDYVGLNNEHHALLPQQVIQLKNWNPYSEFRGASEFRPAKDAADADYMAGKFNLNLMRSNGDQGVYVICKNGELTDTQRQQVTDQLREKHELAQRGIYKPTFLGGDMSVEDPKIRVPDAAFNATRLMNRHEIFMAFGVPASMADVQASYSIGSASDYFMLVMETCIPTGDKVCKGVAAVLQRMAGPGLEASLNWDEHPVLQAVRRERADVAVKYWQMGVPLKELNDYLDLKMPAIPGWERGYLPATVQPVEEAATVPDAGPQVPPEDYDDQVELMRGLFSPAARLGRLFSARQSDKRNGKPVHTTDHSSEA